MLSKVTPWPWEIGKCKEGSAEIQTPQGAIGEAYYSTEDDEGNDLNIDDDAEALAVASLWVAAPDHALLLAGQVANKCYVGKSDRGVCEPAKLQIDGDPTIWALDLDPFGCPILTPELRAALKAALGLGATP